MRRSIRHGRSSVRSMMTKAREERSIRAVACSSPLNQRHTSGEGCSRHTSTSGYDARPLRRVWQELLHTLLVG